MQSDQRVGEHTIRIGGRFYSVEKLIDQAARDTTSPSKVRMSGASALVITLCITMNLLGHKLLPIMGVVVALMVHKAGYYLGRVLLRDGGEAATPISASRRAIADLCGPAAGLLLATLLSIFSEPEWADRCPPLINGLLFVSVLNLLPIKPFSGYSVVEHLVFIRFPKVQLFYLAGGGVVMFIMYAASFYKHDHPYYAFFFIILLSVMFYGFKKVDNMSDMIMRLRRTGADDFNQGHYRAKTIEQMAFSLALFDEENELTLPLLLREVWNKAWEVPALFGETCVVLLIYIILLVSSLMHPAVAAIFSDVI